MQVGDVITIAGVYKPESLWRTVGRHLGLVRSPRELMPFCVHAIDAPVAHYRPVR